MISNISSVLNSPEFKMIPSSVTAQEFIDCVIPKGYENLIFPSTDGIDVYLNIINKEENYESQIMISSSIYTSRDVNFPMFLFTNLKTVSFELNQNQILHLIMTSRFEQFKGMVRPYLNLLNKDIKVISDYMDYVVYNSYNTKIKVDNSKVIIPFKDYSNLGKDFVDIFSLNSMDEAKWNSFFLNNNIYPSSIGSMTSSNSVVMGENIKYRSPAYSQKGEGFTTIFPVSSNIPARLQTHLLGNAVSLYNPDTSVVQQDNIIVDGKLLPKDNTYRKTICVFHEMNEDTCRLMAGEIEILPSVADTLVILTKNVEDNFETLNVVEGETYTLDFKPFLLGTTLLGNDIVIENAKQITIKSIRLSGINGTKKIYYDLVTKAGNARITSNTGIKGVTKVRNNLGIINFKDIEVEKEGLSNEELKKRYPALDLRTLKKYTPTKQTLSVHPEMVLGMNSAKAKSNSIVLAGACLAVELGFYTPSEKAGFPGLLNSLDEKEINEAYNSLPDFTYTNEFGVEEKVYIGLVYINYTELGSTYTKVKEIPFAFEAGRYMAQDSNPTAKALYDYIWNKYLEEDKIEAVKELYECYLNSTEGVFNNPRNIPIYNLDKINEHFSEKDLILNQLQEFHTDSKLLDEDFNSNGFFIDLSKFKGSPVIQIPSAKSLKLFSGEMKNGKLIYHVNVINVSKIIRGCLKINGTYSLNTVYSKNKERYTSALAFNSYLNTLKSTIFSGPMDSQHLVQSFIKPKILGCNLKTVLESWLPDNTVVITDKNIYKRFQKESMKGAPQDLLDKQDVMLMYLANNLNTLDTEKLKEVFEVFNENCIYSLGIRNPMLWKTQISKVKVWDKETFDLYLKIYHGKTVEQIVNIEYNKDVVLTSLNLLVMAHGDSDGDLYPMFILDYEGQQLLKKFELSDILQEELNWNESYKLSELSGNKDLYKDQHVYKLHYITNKEYKKFLVNACSAKTNIGPSTIDSWVWAMLLECYDVYFKQNKGIYQKGDSKASMVQITEHEKALLNFVYVVLLQELVVMGIKHVKNGSKDFEIYLLREIGKQVNESKIRQSLRSRYNLSDQLINKLLYIVRFSEDNNNLVKGCRNFVSLYNKGTFPKDSEALDYWSDFIVANTYFGTLLEPMTKIKQSVPSEQVSTSDLLASLGL